MQFGAVNRSSKAGAYLFFFFFFSWSASSCTVCRIPTLAISWSRQMTIDANRYSTFVRSFVRNESCVFAVENNSSTVWSIITAGHWLLLYSGWKCWRLHNTDCSLAMHEFWQLSSPVVTWQNLNNTMQWLNKHISRAEFRDKAAGKEWCKR